ncbi:MAG TPA: hypothetical protein VJV79_09060 [Polyangiaceae bacterium]|nr:hypothetical protein [Polyangiaceae bacterium]
MTKRAVHSVQPLAGIVALCVVLLQLVNTLHFALVPHGFGAGLGGFVHLHRALTAEPERASSSVAGQPAANRPTFVAGIATSASEACPLGFSDPPSRPVPPSQLSSLIWLPLATVHVSRAQIEIDRHRVLLSAPKTSPPLTV